MKRAILLVLLGCGPDAFYSVAPLDIDGDATDGGQTSPESAADSEALSDSADSSAPSSDGATSPEAAADSGEVCPMIGAACSPVGLRKCRGPQLVWYCGGTWTSNACTQGNPACMPCDAGYCCTISPVCP